MDPNLAQALRSQNPQHHGGQGCARLKEFLPHAEVAACTADVFIQFNGLPADDAGA